MKLIVDTDVGIDDAVALLMLLAQPQVELLAITTVMGNISLVQATHNAGVILDAASAPEIPIFQGCARPLRQTPPLDAADIHGADGLGGASSGKTTARQPQPLPAALALIRLVRDHPGDITLLTLGPLTNVALAARLDAGFLANLKQLVMMGGSVDGRGNTTPPAEFNVMVDPEAAAVVLDGCRRAGTEAVLVSWEATLAHPQPLAMWEETIAGDSPVAAMMRQITDHFKQRPWFTSQVLWPDPLAAAVALQPEIVQAAESRAVSVDFGSGPGRGQTIVDYRHNSHRPPNCRIVRQVDTQQFHRLLQAAVRQNVRDVG
ncbi:MAG: nucleoside hydrolase [Anaerolineae bacterium]